MENNADKRAAFLQRIKVDISKNQKNKVAKRAQVSSNNANNSNHASAPARQRSVAQGRGNER